VLICIENDAKQRIACDGTLMQQLDEWGMHVLQLSMPRIKDWMKFEEQGERNVTLTMMIFFHNYKQGLLG
jgi:hypothetical protein